MIVFFFPYMQEVFFQKCFSNITFDKHSLPKIFGQSINNTISSIFFYTQKNFAGASPKFQGMQISFIFFASYKKYKTVTRT